MFCLTCHNDISDGTQCSICQKLNCFTCSGITEGGYRKLGADRQAVWKCPLCRSSPSHVLPTSENTALETILQRLDQMASKLDQIPRIVLDIDSLKGDIAELKNSCQFTSDKIDDFSGKLVSLNGRIVTLENAKLEVDATQAALASLRQDYINKDQLSRLNNVEVKGIPTKKEENLFKILDKLGKHVGFVIEKSQINYISRVPAYDSKDKHIVIGFLNRYVKEDFLAAARMKKSIRPSNIGFEESDNKSGNIFVNDHLSPDNKKLLTRAKQIASEKHYQFVWVKFAKIHIRKNDKSPVIIINSQADLNKIV